MLEPNTIESAAADPTDRRNKSSARVLKVCLVEDDKAQQEALAVILERAGYEVYCASNGTQAIPLLSDCQPDIVLCDMIMPVCEGFEVLRHAKSIVPEARFLMMSGGTGEFLDVLKDAQLLGADAILRKPFAPMELLKSLESLGKKD